MRTNTKIIILCFLLSLIHSSALAQVEMSESHSFTLEDCIKYAFTNNIKRLNLKLTERNAELSHELSKNAKRPQVSGSFGETLSHTGHEESVNLSGSLGVNAGVTIYQGGSINNNIKKSKLESQKAERQTFQYDHNLIIQILGHFMTAISSKEMMERQQLVLDMQKEQLRQGEEKYKVGAILESDYLLLKAQYETDKCNLLNSQITYENAMLSLKQSLSMESTEDLSLVYPDTADLAEMAILPEISTIIDRTLFTNPEIHICEINTEIAKISKEITKAGRRPTISASAGLHTSHRNFDGFGEQLGNNFGQNIGISLSIPIYDRGNTKTSLKMREVEEKIAELNLRDKELELSQIVTQEVSNVNLSYSQCNAYRLKAEAYKQVYEAYMVKFQYGTITSVELLQQQNNYINSMTDYVNSKYNFILRRKLLDVYMDYPVTYAVKE